MNIENEEELSLYLEKQLLLSRKELKGCRILPGGVSNRTVLVEQHNGNCWVVKQALSKLKVQVDWFCDPARIHQEADGIRFLSRHAPKTSVPQLWFEDKERYLLGMKAVKEPHQVWKSQLLSGEINMDAVKKFADMLVSIQAFGPGIPGIPDSFANKTYFEALRLEPYYGYAATQLPKARNFLLELMESTRSKRKCLVHGDFSPKNVLVQGDTLHLIDHEVIHLGDDAFDLGFSLTHFLAKAIHMPEKRISFRDACHLFVQRFLDGMNRSQKPSDLEESWIRHTLGCLLARVRGRSPLEYLKDSDKEQISLNAQECIEHLPADIHLLIDRITWDKK